MAPPDAIFGKLLIALIDISHADWGHRRPTSASGDRQEPKPDRILFEEACRLEQAAAHMGQAREFLKEQRVLEPA